MKQNSNEIDTDAAAPGAAASAAASCETIVKTIPGGTINGGSNRRRSSS